MVYYILGFSITSKANLEVTFSMQHQLLLAADELKQLEPQIKDSFNRLSTLTANLLDPLKPIKIQRWDPSKYHQIFQKSIA